MCLSTIEPLTKKVKKRRFGWKLFDHVKKDGTLVPYIYSASGKQRSRFSYKTDKWYQSTENYNGYPNYPLGFHVYQTKKEAQQRASRLDHIQKVQIKDIVAYGWQNRGKVIVARKMRILP